ncbi:unnamed protein product [Spirodela intermedia]|uniref:Uncharacterized protein n=2 Tax=Spirodela intermedia TaxID=51605 RepID=A0A7I8JJM6_SPIIN|nr:unnamed protein product [Spirodela intermedia]CAA6669783.1 unnamed protein product [Spirodela intermedia]CAA7406754.1 unnamed protein product [Spirodela intermedia]
MSMSKHSRPNSCNELEEDIRNKQSHTIL